MAHEITLYQFETCPYCAKVRAKLDELGFEYTAVNVSRDREDQQRIEIAEKAGVQTVPIINVDGKWMGDSEAIVTYLIGLNPGEA